MFLLQKKTFQVEFKKLKYNIPLKFYSHIYTLWKQKHKFAWNVPKFKTRAQFTKLFLMPSQANPVLRSSEKSFPQCRFFCIPMKPALSKGYTP